MKIHAMPILIISLWMSSFALADICPSNAEISGTNPLIGWKLFKPPFALTYQFSSAIYHLSSDGKHHITCEYKAKACENLCPTLLLLSENTYKTGNGNWTEDFMGFVVTCSSPNCEFIPAREESP